MNDGANLPEMLLDAARRVIDANRAAGLRVVVAESAPGFKAVIFSASVSATETFGNPEVMAVRRGRSWCSAP